jgi:hypothetical protein
MVTIVQPLLNDNETEALHRILKYLADEDSDYVALTAEDRPKHIFHSVLCLRACGFLFPHAFSSVKTSWTPGASDVFQRAGQEPAEFLARHFAGDWGDVSAEDWKGNQYALENGLRILSSYHTSAGEQLWVITEADRSVTTLLLPEEY